MIYLTAICFPPLYFLIKRKWFGCILHSTNCAMGILVIHHAADDLGMIGLPMMLMSSLLAVGDYDYEKDVWSETSTMSLR